MVSLIIDVGNTNATFGVYEQDEIKSYWRLATKNITTADEFGLFIISMIGHWHIDSKEIEGVAVSSVVPNVMYSLTHGIQKYIGLEPFIASPATDTCIDLKNMKDKMELGADRLVNLVGAYENYKGNCIVIDYGTATTYDAVDKDGVFITGVTSPGIKTALDALCQNSALLGNVAIVTPPTVLTTNTIESLQAGIVFGVAGETQFIVNRIIEEMNWKREDVTVIATGGLSKTIGEAIDIFDSIDVNLTLDGIKIMYDKYRVKTQRK